MSRRRRESGLALLVVLLTIALLTIVVMEFTYSAQVETHFALAVRNGLQAYYLARSGVNIGELLLLRDPSKGTDSEQDLWAQRFPPLPAGDGTIALRIRDEGSVLNLNGILSGDSVRPERVAIFTRLFDLLGIDQQVLAAIVDWIDSDNEPRTTPMGAEQPYYLGMTPPVTVRNGPLVTLRELLSVRGVTPAILERLEGFVAVHRRQDGLVVNVNTAPAEVLYALSEGLSADPGIVDRLIATRREQPFLTQGDWRSIPGFDEALGESRAFVKLGSMYFRIEAMGTVNQTTRGIVARVRRDGGRLQRVTWTPSLVPLALTSQSPSDFLKTLSPPGSG